MTHIFTYYEKLRLCLWCWKDVSIADRMKSGRGVNCSVHQELWIYMYWVLCHKLYVKIYVANCASFSYLWKVVKYWFYLLWARSPLAAHISGCVLFIVKIHIENKTDFLNMTFFYKSCGDHKENDFVVKKRFI